MIPTLRDPRWGDNGLGCDSMTERLPSVGFWGSASGFINTDVQQAQHTDFPDLPSNLDPTPAPQLLAFLFTGREDRK